MAAKKKSKGRTTAKSRRGNPSETVSTVPQAADDTASGLPPEPVEAEAARPPAPDSAEPTRRSRASKWEGDVGAAV
jgi:hypothetical protein